jgi:hypothetical protein
MPVHFFLNDAAAPLSLLALRPENFRRVGAQPGHGSCVGNSILHHPPELLLRIPDLPLIAPLFWFRIDALHRPFH